MLRSREKLTIGVKFERFVLAPAKLDAYRPPFATENAHTFCTSTLSLQSDQLSILLPERVDASMGNNHFVSSIFVVRSSPEVGAIPYQRESESCFPPLQRRCYRLGMAALSSTGLAVEAITPDTLSTFTMRCDRHILVA